MYCGQAWGSGLLLILAASANVTANYQRHHDPSIPYDGDDFLDLANNITRGHAELHRTHHQQRDGSDHWRQQLQLPHLRHHNQRVSHGRGPYFENAHGQEINGSENAVHLGDTAMLDCRVVMLSGKMVMWIRQSPNAALLTVGKSTHISDPRYEVRFKYPNNWRLAISSIQKEDHGLYVCQVNTHPPKMLVTNVTILAPDIRIVDEANHELRDRYYKTGSIIELTCIARPSRPGSKVPRPVWKKNDEPLSEHVNLHHSNGTDGELLTRLRIEEASKSDGGEFACTIGQFSTTVVNIHVLNGEKQAAVHHDQWNDASGLSSHCHQTAILILLLLMLGSSCASRHLL